MQDLLSTGPIIDQVIERISRQCTACVEFQNWPAKTAIHSWMLPEKPWSRLHKDHGIAFLGHNWLVLVNAYSEYACICMTGFTFTKTTTEFQEQNFAHFGHPHTLVTDNTTTFTFLEFQAWCKARGIVHLTGAPCNLATNGVAERLVQTFKISLKKSKSSLVKALQDFLMQCRSTPLLS